MNLSTQLLKQRNIQHGILFDLGRDHVLKKILEAFENGDKEWK